jgi:thiopeptide-type bacteriocin biosynthesis protein
VTGPEPIYRLVKSLGARPATAAIAERLDAARCGLAAMDAAGPGVSPDRYRGLARTLDDGHAKADLSRLFQVDLVRAAPQVSLGRDVVEEIAAGVRLLHRLSPGGEDPRLRRFREAFTARYEAREVPLVEALDEELGIGFEVAAERPPLLRGLEFPAGPAEAPRWAERDDALLETLAEALGQGRREIVLDEPSVQRMAAEAPLPLPPTFSVIATLAATSIAAVTGGDFRVWLEGVEGPSGAELLGRFCQADLALHRRVEALLRAEELHDPEAVFAEIVHVPAGRLGNILRRPVLRGHEIPYLGSSGAQADRQIPVADLLVSVRAEQIVLRSARLGRRVLPRLTSSHDWESASLGMYRFLCALQVQGTAGHLAWNWGPLAAAPFLPRVTAGRVVFARARWRVGQDQLRRLGAATGAARYRAVQEWRAERGLARFVVLADGDHRLPIDLDNALAVEAFVHGVKGREEAVLEEAWPAPDALCVEGPEGRFVHELVVPFVRAADAVASCPATRHAASTPLPRSFPPGSEWLFVKVYTGAATADDVLIETVAPVARRMLASRTADRWFFVRYGDPDWHLRVRFHGDPAALQRRGWPALRDALGPLIDDGRAWRMSLDTYERETERYGGPEGVELAERVFHADSDAVVSILALLDPGDPGLDVRWRLALRGMARLLDDLGLDVAPRTALLRDAREALGRELRVGRALRRQLGERWEKARADVARLLDPARDDEHPLAPGLAVLRARSARIRPVAQALRGREAANRLTVPVRELAASFLHMHANRLLRSAGRQQELVLYDFLVRHYEGQMHRARA